MGLRRTSITLMLVVGIGLGLLPLPAQAQEFPTLTDTSSLVADLSCSEYSPLESLSAYFPSEIIRSGISLKAYVRSPRFRALRSRFGDQKGVDAVYLQALRLTRGNTGLSLLLSTLATMDHRVVGIRVPMLKIFFPLTNESDREFARRTHNLPARLYADSPSGRTGDRDKLQHFFGSAFIAYSCESRGAAERVGRFVEWGEDAFIVDGAYDERDVRANTQGREFGLALLRAASEGGIPATKVLPSDFLKVVVAHRGSPASQSDSVHTPQNQTPGCRGW
jgi:hypothetical protein